MNIIRNGDWYLATLITGPTHNFLGLRLSTRTVNELVVEAKPGATGENRLSADDVVRSVLAGVQDANGRLETRYHVSGIRYVEDDTPGYSTIKGMAHAIIAHAFEQTGDLSKQSA